MPLPQIPIPPWAFALALAASAPMLARLLAERWHRGRREMTEQLLAKARAPGGSDGAEPAGEAREGRT